MPKLPGAPLSVAEQKIIGSYTHTGLPNCTPVAELYSKGSESDVQRLQKELEKLVKDTLIDFKKSYQADWDEWNTKSATGKAAELIEESFAGFIKGTEDWWKGEQELWSWLDDVLGEIWGFITETLGDITEALHPHLIGQTMLDLWESAQA